MPIRVQRSREKGWRMPENTLYVGRPTIWGNPYKVVDISPGVFSVRLDKYVNDETVVDILTGTCHLEYSSKRAANKDCISAYEMYLEYKMKKDPTFLDKLKGYNLTCWCNLNSPCHADILI